MQASSEGRTSVVEKMLAFGAKPEKTNEVKVRGRGLYRGRGAGLVEDHRRRKQGQGGGKQGGSQRACVRARREALLLCATVCTPAHAHG